MTDEERDREDIERHERFSIYNSLIKQCKSIEDRLYKDYVIGEIYIDDKSKEHKKNAKIRMNKSVYGLNYLFVDVRNDEMFVSVKLYNEEKTYISVVLQLEQFEKLFVKNSLS